MHINNLDKIGAISLGSAIVGSFGAYNLRSIISVSSLSGVGLACGITAAIGAAIFFDKELDGFSKFTGFMSAYPAGWIVSNLVRYHVRWLDPILSVFAGVMALTPFVIAAYALTFLDSQNKASLTPENPQGN